MATAKSHTPIGRSRSPETEEGSGLSGIGKNFLKDASETLGKFGGDFMEQLFGIDSQTPSPEAPWQPEATPSKNEIQFRPLSRERVTVFSLREQRESREIQQIKELLKQIKEELKAIKSAESSMAAEIKAAEKLTIEVDPKGGVYHIRFLEVILKLLNTARQKLGESNAWLGVMQSKKKKRGSAFAANSKKLGTQYSMSQELSNARSIQ